MAGATEKVREKIRKRWTELQLRITAGSPSPTASGVLGIPSLGSNLYTERVLNIRMITAKRDEISVQYPDYIPCDSEEERQWRKDFKGALEYLEQYLRGEVM